MYFAIDFSCTEKKWAISLFKSNFIQFHKNAGKLDAIQFVLERW